MTKERTIVCESGAHAELRTLCVRSITHAESEGWVLVFDTSAPPVWRYRWLCPQCAR